MATVLFPNVLVQVRIWSQVTAAFQAAVNTAWYFCSSVGSPPAFDTDVADQVDSLIATDFKALLSSTAEYRGVQVILHGSSPSYAALTLPVAAAAGAGNGTSGADLMPKQTAGILKFQTLRPGPSGRGRFYLPFPSTASDSGGGTPSAGYSTAVITFGADIGVGLAISQGGRTALLIRVLVHRKNKAGLFPDPSPVIDWSTSGLWATQKRRGSYGRQNLSPI